MKNEVNIEGWFQPSSLSLQHLYFSSVEHISDPGSGTLNGKYVMKYDLENFKCFKVRHESCANE